jgi:hypothetical protein
MTSDDLADSRLCALIRRKAERPGRERGAEGFTNGALSDAALIEAMSIAGGTSKQVRGRLLTVIDEALLGPASAELPEPPPGASLDEMRAHVEALGIQVPALKGEVDADALLMAEIKCHGARPGTPLRDIFTEEELAKMPR